MQDRRSMLKALFATGATIVLARPAFAEPPRKATIKVFKKHFARCCDEWIREVKRAGFGVLEVGVSDLDAVKVDYDIPKSLAGCHTAVVQGYIIEGHVPPAEIDRLLEEHPLVRGIAVAGHPVENEPVVVMQFDGEGNVKPFPPGKVRQ